MAYAGTLPAEELARQSVQRREAQWQQWLGPRAPQQVFVAVERAEIIGFAAAGASRDTRLRQPVRLEAYEVAQALDCDAAAAGAWLAAATPFAHYVLSRRNRAETWVAAGGVGLAAR